MKVDFDLEGVEDLALGLSASLDNFGADLRQCVLRAGDAAITEMQTNHPYQDQTYLLSAGMRCRLFGRQTRTMAEAIITFEAHYANIVNDGSVKTKAYPFVPQGLQAGGRELEKCVSTALWTFCHF